MERARKVGEKIVMINRYEVNLEDQGFGSRENWRNFEPWPWRVFNRGGEDGLVLDLLGEYARANCFKERLRRGRLESFIGWSGLPSFSLGI